MKHIIWTFLIYLIGALQGVQCQGLDSSNMFDASFEKDRLQNVVYDLSAEPIDVVIPCSAKDAYDSLPLCIKGIKKYGANVRRVIVVSPEKFSDEAEWFDEKLYPFSKDEVAYEMFQDAEMAKAYCGDSRNRLGWLYQQLLKLYAPFVIPGISSNVLILDSDVIFLNPVNFLNKQNGGLYCVGTEYCAPYFEHAARLLPGLKKEYAKWSGVVHHMLFQRSILQDIFNKVETHHGEEMWKAICHCVDRSILWYSFCSEYEIYFNYAFAHTSQVEIRHLKWNNVNNLKNLVELKAAGYHFVGWHAYSRDKSGPCEWIYPLIF